MSEANLEKSIKELSAKVDKIIIGINEIKKKLGIPEIRPALTITIDENPEK